jgi:GNAT superfamily N-acetyltransferase
MMPGLCFIPYYGQSIEEHVDELAALRMAVFREFPYLYEGSLEYEREYLQTYVQCEQSLVVLVYDQGTPVGATTCLPMTAEGPEFQAAFLAAGLDLAEVCYFGESILLPEYRGHGVGKEFMQRRLEHARRLPGVRKCAFCAVDRPSDHPSRPEDFRPLDGFWQAEGFIRRPELKASLLWKEIGEENESQKRLTFWVKELG